MNTDYPHNSPEALEVEITALILGELAPADAEKLRRQIAANPALQGLRDRLEQAVRLAKELALSDREQANRTVPVDLKLDASRREQLLKAFRTVREVEFAPTRRRSRTWILPVAVAAMICLFGAALFLPTWSRSKARSQRIAALHEGRAYDEMARVPSTELELRRRGTAPAPAAAAAMSAELADYDNSGSLGLARVELVLPPTEAALEEKIAQADRVSEGATASLGVSAANSDKSTTWSLYALDDADLSSRRSGGVIDASMSGGIGGGGAATTEAGRANIVASSGTTSAVGDTLSVAPPPPSVLPGSLPAPANRPVKPQRTLNFGVASAGGQVSAPAGTATFGESLSAGEAGKPLQAGSYFYADTDVAARTRAKAVSPVPSTATQPSTPAPTLGDIPVLGRDFRPQEQAQAGGTPKNVYSMNVVGYVEIDPSVKLHPKPKKEGEVVLGYPQAGSGAFLQETERLRELNERFSQSEELVRKGTVPLQTNAQVRAEDVESSTRFMRRYGLAPQQAEAAGRSAAAARGEPTQEEKRKKLAAGLSSALKAPAPSASAPVPQPEIQSDENPFSTFSLNVSDVSYQLAAAALNQGTLPDPAGIRSEEFINAFDYRDPEPAPGAPVALAWERARYPFAHNRDLLRLSVKTAAQGRQAGRPLNLVLLLDNSGSMERADRVQIIREALKVLATQLQPHDKLSVVTFARTAALRADGVAGNQAAQVLDELGQLTPEGGTNLEEAMNVAYATARKHYLQAGINRVVLLTDGAANLGTVNPEQLKQQVETQRKQGIALDCFGIGWEGYNDDMLEVLSRNGDGRYAFINTPEEAGTDFAAKQAGALQIAASDVKVQVEFNPQRVSVYRQVGYAKHQLTKEQFRDNRVDAAEIAAAEAGNAIYILQTNPEGNGPIGFVRVRYKVPGTEFVHEHEWAIPYEGTAVELQQSTPSMRLAASASAFSEWLAGSPWAAEVTPDGILKMLEGVPAVYGPDARAAQLVTLVQQAKRIGGR